MAKVIIKGSGGNGGECCPVTAIDVEYLNGDIINVQEALDQLLYKAPVITSFVNNVNTVEKGTIVTSVKLNWVFNKPMIGASIDNGIGSVLGLNEYIHSGQNITTNRTYSLNAFDEVSGVTRTTSITFLNKVYWGTNGNSDLTALNILSLEDSELASSRLQTRVINGGGKYMVFAYPASFGPATFNVNGLANTALTSVTKSFTNSKGFTENYLVYRTNTIQNGTLTIQVK